MHDGEKAVIFRHGRVTLFRISQLPWWRYCAKARTDGCAAIEMPTTVSCCRFQVRKRRTHHYPVHDRIAASTLRFIGRIAALQCLASCCLDRLPFREYAAGRLIDAGIGRRAQMEPHGEVAARPMHDIARRDDPAERMKGTTVVEPAAFFVPNDFHPPIPVRDYPNQPSGDHRN